MLEARVPSWYLRKTESLRTSFKHTSTPGIHGEPIPR
jgi:hypothetical protein